jgi:NAD(P)-dependent dehydrogenase (short-subunit alcohol dehydrogenase family)
MKDLNGKRFIIAGGTGMGAALAVRLVRQGSRIVVGDINRAGLDSLAPQMTGESGKGVVFPFDLADEASIGPLVQRCVDEYGGIDGLAITAADLSKATLGNDHDILHMDPRIWRRTLEVNLLGPALLIRATIPHIVKAGGGSIVVISSGAANAGLDYIPAYASSKAGLQALVRHVAAVCGKDNVRCNGICPGTIRTEGAKVNMKKEILEGPPRNALQRHGQPDDVARVMAFLLSEESSWMTGQIISANGGANFRD